MKKNKLVLLTATGLLVAGLAGVKASAAEVTVGTEKQSKTTVEIKNKDDNDDKKPTDADIYLLHVPTDFKFESVVQNKNYDIQGTGVVSDNATGDESAYKNTIAVFNNKLERSWSVKAKIDEISTKDEDDNAVKTVEGTRLTIQDKEVGTGADAIVHEAEENKTQDNNTGKIAKEINKIDIKFQDTNNVLKAGDVLTGQVHYTLYATPVTK